MPKNCSSYQRLSLNKKEGVYSNVYPQKVLTMQDPYNLSSYNIDLETQCKGPNNSRSTIMENFKLPYSLNDPYNLSSYDSSCY